MKSCGRPVNADKLTPLARNLRKLRGQKGLTQKEVAAQLGYSIYAYRKWEYGKDEPHLQSLLDICDVYHVSPNELLDWKGEV